MQTNANLEFRKIKSLNYLYEINENGTILRNVKSKKQTKITISYHHANKGYYIAFVHLGGRKNPIHKRVMIHVVVAECWLGARPVGYEVDHINRNSLDNNWTNLRYVTKSEQMKNRDHSNISKRGAKNLEEARKIRMKPVKIIQKHDAIIFESYASCSRYLSNIYGCSFDSIRDRLKRGSSHIKDYDVIYLNAETVRGGSTEQETVHKSDLTGDYQEAFNEGKQQEVEMRVKHNYE